ncbi:hypothetical protein D5086_016979 [Populus alba]|uniref:Uncharacterized protein n=1 Tax=Populus alba TaxID=43335 RepID=A0ACC4BW24_POPAL
MGTPETSREPCPDRILDDIGGAFGMGAVGGSAFHFLKGVHNSPSGARLMGEGGSLELNHRRRRHGRLSLHAARAWRLRSVSCIWWRFCLGLIERSWDYALNKVLGDQQSMPIMIDEDPIPAMAGGGPGGFPMGQAQEGESGSWLGGWFGGEKKKKESTAASSKTEVLESFDAPPVPTFEYK